MTSTFSIHQARDYLVAIAMVAFCAPSFAQISTFMRVDGLPGESISPRHFNEIDLISYSQTFGTRNCSRAVAAKRIDRASPGLISRAAANTLIPQVMISMSRLDPKGNPDDFFRATLDLVLVDRIELAQGGNEVQENVVFAPRSMRIEYRPQLPSGSYGNWVVSTVACDGR